jgi:hypothetical protein
MRVFSCVAALALLIAVPAVVRAQMTSTSIVYGAGPHGYDWAIGTWSCTNGMPSPMGGPTNTTLTVTRTNGGAIMYRSVGTNFDNSWYNVYVAKSKSWVSPFIVADGSYGTEATSQTGKKIVWTGTAVDGSSGKTMKIRDTNVIFEKRYTDLGEYWSAGAWKAQYNVTCVRS